jgi:predicted phage-related endonuclease
MSAPLPIAFAEDRTRWVELRREGVTATDVAGIPDKGLTDAALRRILADKRGHGSDYRSAAMTHGSKREPVIAAWVERESSHGAFGSGTLSPSSGLFAHPEHAWRLATPDGVSADWDAHRELVEIKTTVHEWRSIPRAYLRQVWWAQHVTGADRTLVVWERHEDGIPTAFEPSWCWVDRDDAELAALIPLAIDLHTHIRRQRADGDQTPFDMPDTTAGEAA